MDLAEGAIRTSGSRRLTACQLPLGQWIIEYEGDDPIVGDLRDDARADRRWPASGDHRRLAWYLWNREACQGAMRALRRAELIRTGTAPTRLGSGRRWPPAVVDGWSEGWRPGRVPGHLRWRVEAAESWTENAIWDLVANCVEWGWDGLAVRWAVMTCEAIRKQYPEGGRWQLAAEVRDLTAKLRKQHPHVGKPCDRAECPNAPQWLRRT